MQAYGLEWRNAFKVRILANQMNGVIEQLSNLQQVVLSSRAGVDSIGSPDFQASGGARAGDQPRDVAEYPGQGAPGIE